MFSGQRWMVLIVLIGGQATEISGRPLAATVSSGSAEDGGPILQGQFPVRLRFQVLAAVELAARQFDREAGCRALFARFGTDGRKLLRRETYRVARSNRERQTCTRRSAAAFTTVGGSQTHLCPRRFTDLTVSRAAMILIHEALHHAGMPEWPAEPSAPTSQQLNRLIRERCRL